MRNSPCTVSIGTLSSFLLMLRFYLANRVDFNTRSAGQDVYFDVQLTDAWVWDVYRPSRFVKSVRIVTFKDVNVEEIQKTDIDVPQGI